MVDEARAKEVLQLMAVHWRADLGPRVSGCRALGVSGLNPVHWCVRLGPVLSGG